jgi:hypothetical protein
MINETTDVYSIMKNEFSETVEHFHMMNNKEIAAFLYYNAHNEQFIGTDKEYYHNVNFKNLDTGKCSRMFTEGPIYFFPTGNDFVEPSNRMTAFRIHSSEAKVIRINDKGLFVEMYNFEDNSITTYYYDMSALASLSEFGYAAGSIDYIDEKIQERDFKPDKTFYAKKSADGIYFSIKENGETVFEEQKPLDENRTFYSVYFEKMKSMGLYLEAQKVDTGTSR